MKYFFAAIFALLLMSPYKSQVRKDFVIPPHPRIGLSLAGGGAKGFAHVGVLKLLDSLGVKVDYISGTSMGAIVGGLYAAGYTGKEIEKVVMDTDFFSLIANEKTRQEFSFFNKTVDKYLLTVPVKDGKVYVLPKAISTGQKNIYLLKELFRNVANINDFSKLPIPYMCVATNLESGKMKIFESGDLVSSIMASSAFPSLMDPVKIKDSLYIDGAMTVNYPSKPLKDKGIDVVIGVDLSQGLATAKDLQSAVAILNQVIDYGIQKETKNQYKYTDINIHPNLEGLGATSYDDKERILDSGLVEAKKYAHLLDKLPKRPPTLLRAPQNPIYSNVYKIDSLVLENGKIFGRNYVLGKMNLKTPSLQTYSSVNTMVDKLYATNNYTLINYDIVQKNNKNYLVLHVTEDPTRFFLKFGLHYDEIFRTGLLLNATAKRLLFRNSTASLDIVVGDKPRYYFNYFIDNGNIPGFGLYASGMNIELKDKETSITRKWNWFRNEAFLQSVWRDKYALGGGLSQDIFDDKSETVQDGASRTHNFLNPYIFIKSDTQDDKEFATKGIYINAEGKVIDLFNKKNIGRTIQAKMQAQINIPVAKWMTYRFGAFAGLTFGNNLSEYYNYYLGGVFEQNLNNFTKFYGYNFGQIASQNLITITNSVQMNVYKNFFATAHLGVANHFEDINVDKVVKINETSGGLTAGYKSPFGQIKLDYSRSFTTNKGTFTAILGHWF